MSIQMILIGVSKLQHTENRKHEIERFKAESGRYLNVQQQTKKKIEVGGNLGWAKDIETYLKLHLHYHFFTLATLKFSMKASFLQEPSLNWLQAVGCRTNNFREIAVAVDMVVDGVPFMVSITSSGFVGTDSLQFVEEVVQKLRHRFNRFNGISAFRTK
jgi:hypothetical protein